MVGKGPYTMKHGGVRFLASFFWLFRLNRSVMVAAISGTAAYTAGAGWRDCIWLTLGAWFLAVGGFSLDFYADRDLDEGGVRARLRRNPIASGILPPAGGLFFSVLFITLSFAVTLLKSQLSLIPWVVILLIILGLALHLFEKPLSRAVTLGLLQALYVFMGALAGRINLASGILAAMFFFAMFGGRGMIDIRDFPQDQVTRVQTLPAKYGIRFTALFTLANLVAACALSLAAYFTGFFEPIYLYLDIAFVVVGMFCGVLFACRPSPKLALYLTPVFMMGEGTLICTAMILGTRRM